MDKWFFVGVSQGGFWELHRRNNHNFKQGAFYDNQWRGVIANNTIVINGTAGEGIEIVGGIGWHNITGNNIT